MYLEVLFIIIIVEHERWDNVHVVSDNLLNKMERLEMGKKRVQKVKCPNKDCKEINVDEQIELGNYDVIGSIKFIYCPMCGEEIIIN